MTQIKTILSGILFLILGMMPCPGQKYHCAESCGVRGNVKTLTSSLILAEADYTVAEYNYTFNKLGELTGYNNTMYENGEPDFMSYNVYGLQYDRNNYLTEYMMDDVDDEALVTLEYKTIAGQVVPVKETTSMLAGGDQLVVYYRYDAAGNIIGRTSKTFNSKGELTEEMNLTYRILERDSRGNWTFAQLTHTGKDGNLIFNEKRAITYWPAEPKAAEPTPAATAPGIPVATQKVSDARRLTLNQLLTTVGGYGLVGKSIKFNAAALRDNGVNIDVDGSKEITLSFGETGSSKTGSRKTNKNIQVAGLPDDFSGVDVAYSDPGKLDMRCQYTFRFVSKSTQEQQTLAQTLVDAILQLAKGFYIDFRYNESSKKYIANSSAHGRIYLWLTLEGGDTGVALTVDQSKRKD